MTLGERFRGGWVFLEHKKSMHVFFEPQGFFFPSFFFLVLVDCCLFFLLGGGGSSGPFFFLQNGMLFVK